MRLGTERLILRDWDRKDIPDLVAGLDDLRVSRWLAFVPHPFAVQDAERWLAHCAAISQLGEGRTDYEFAIELKREQKAIGGVSLTRIDRFHGTAGGGIWIHAAYHGYGYGREAFGAKIRFAFEDLALRRLENGFFEGNGASAAMLERLGYKLEGKKRAAYRCMADGELKDEVIVALLREDWRGV
jgi:RimJ/RimL family protein N-acetyltransferase